MTKRKKIKLLADALIASTKENLIELEEIGGCDHSVGICMCSFISMIDKNIMLLETITKKSCKELGLKWDIRPDYDPIDIEPQMEEK